MKPILFNEEETRFDTYGMGEIDVLDIQIERIRNGNYTIYFEYPANGPLASVLKNGMQIKADAGTRTKNQTFDITRVVKNSGKTIKVYGHHIKHRLEKIVFRNGQAFGGSASTALATLKNIIVGDNNWDVASDITTTGKGVFDISKMGSVHSALGGVEGSILDIYGGEYEFDNRTIRLHKQLGRTAPTVLEYGRNILSVESDESIEGVYTTVYPFASYTPETQGDTGSRSPEPVVVELPEKVVDSKYRPLYTHQKIKVVDFSSSFKEKEIPTAEKLRKLATDYMNNNEIGKPKLNVKIEYVDLASTLDSATKQVMEEIELCDIIPVYYPPLGITSNDAKVVRVVYNPVLERNTSVEFGQIGSGIKSAMTGNLSAQVADIAKNQQQLVNSLPDYLLNAQGNKVWYNRPDNSEHKVGDIWFEKNGIYDRMYIWNGSMWEKRIDTEDVDNIKKEVEKKLAESKQATDDAMDRTRAIADLALQRSGSDSIELASKKIIKQVLDGKLFDSSFKKAVNKTFEEVDNGSTIYGKISSEIEKKFITIDATDSRFRQVSEQVDRKVSDAVSGIDGKISSVDNRVSQTNRALTEARSDLNQAKTDISNTRLYIRDANQKIDKTNQKISNVDDRVDRTNQNVTQANGRIDQTNRDLATTNAQVEANKRQIEVQVTNFNAVRESTKLFERILGTTEEGAPDKLSRLVMSSEIFQTEVGKYSTSGGPNMIRNSRADDMFRYWEGQNLERWDHQFYFNGQKYMFMLKQVSWMKSPRFLLKKNTDYMLNFFGFNSGNTKNLKISIRKRKKGQTNDYTASETLFNKSAKPILDTTKAIKKSIKFNTGDFDEGYLYIENAGPDNGADKWSGVFLTEFDLYEGSNDRLWQPAPEDSTLEVDKSVAEVNRVVEATRTQVTQLAGSWAVRNLTNSGDVLNSINLLANGTNRIDGRLTHITGHTMIDNAVIKDGMIASVSANKLTAGTIDARDVNLINLNAGSVTSGTFKGLTFEGGIIRGNNGNTEINLNSNITTYNGTAKIEFKSPGNSLEFNSGGRKAFLAPTVAQYTNYAAFALGVNDRGEHDPNRNYVGLKIFNQPNSRQVEIIGDLMLTSYYNQGIKTTSLRDLFRLIDDNFKRLKDFRVAHGEGSPGFWDIGLS